MAQCLINYVQRQLQLFFYIILNGATAAFQGRHVETVEQLSIQYLQFLPLNFQNIEPL